MNGKNIGTALAVTCIFCVLCYSAPAEEPSAKQSYEKAFRAILSDDYDEAYDRLNEIIARYPDTIYAQLAQDRKRQLENLNLSSLRRKKIDQSGRMESVIFSTLYSTWLGVGSAYLLDAENEKALAAGMMIGAPVGLLSSLALTRNSRLSDGQAALVNFSGYWGTWQGVGLAILLDEEDDNKTLIGSAMAGGLLGILTTSTITRKIDLGAGDASIINYGGLWGTWLSVCIAAVFGVEDANSLLGVALAGGDLGAAAMAVLSTKVEFSLGQASLINLSGVVGTLGAMGFLTMLLPATQIESEEVIFAVLMAGGIIGLWAGYQEFGLRGQDISRRSGLEDLSWFIGNQRRDSSSKEVTARLFSIQF